MRGRRRAGAKLHRRVEVPAQGKSQTEWRRERRHTEESSDMASLAVSIAKNEFIVGGKYRLMRKIGSGSFGDIYLGINISNGEVM